LRARADSIILSGGYEVVKILGTLLFTLVMVVAIKQDKVDDQLLTRGNLALSTIVLVFWFVLFIGDHSSPYSYPAFGYRWAVPS